MVALGWGIGSILIPGLIFIIALTYKKEKPDRSKKLIITAIVLAGIILLESFIHPISTINDVGARTVDSGRLGIATLFQIALIVAMCVVLASMTAKNTKTDSSSNKTTKKSKKTNHNKKDSEDDFDDGL